MPMSVDVASAMQVQPEQGSGKMPRHIAIIMDGNGRWAAQRGLPRTEGHRQGLEALKATVREAIKQDISYLTVFSFSSENWSRPVDEVDFLLKLLKRFVRSDLSDLHKQNVIIRIIGRRDNLPSDIISLIDEAENLTRANTGLTLVVAFNYGARDEILRAAEQLAKAYTMGVVSEADLKNESMLERFLDTRDIPDPDLIIRTSGEERLSNFLLWQAAYAEFVFLDVLWPDFDVAALAKAIAIFSERERRFGGIG